MSALELARQRTAYRQGRATSDAGLQRMVKGLKLDPAQQAEVRRALLAQHEALRRLMSAPTDPGVSRVAAIQAINHRTAQRIRAVLREDQRKLYGQPLPPNIASSEGQPGVEDWLGAMRRKGR